MANTGRVSPSSSFPFRSETKFFHSLTASGLALEPLQDPLGRVMFCAKRAVNALSSGKVFFVAGYGARSCVSQSVVSLSFSPPSVLSGSYSLPRRALHGVRFGLVSAVCSKAQVHAVRSATPQDPRWPPTTKMRVSSVPSRRIGRKSRAPPPHTPPAGCSSVASIFRTYPLLASQPKQISLPASYTKARQSCVDNSSTPSSLMSILGSLLRSMGGDP